MIGREFLTICHHCQLQWNSVGNSANAGWFGSQMKPCVPGAGSFFCARAALANMGQHQKSVANAPPTVRLGSLVRENSKTLPPSVRNFSVAASRRFVTNAPLGVLVSTFGE